MQSLQPAIPRFAGWRSRALIGLGFLITFLAIGFIAGSDRADAAEQGLLDDVTSLVPVATPVLEPVVELASPVVEPVESALAPVVEPVETLIAPVTTPVLQLVTPVVVAPVVDRVEAAAPVIQPVDTLVPVAPAVETGMATGGQRVAPAETAPAPVATDSTSGLTVSTFDRTHHLPRSVSGSDGNVAAASGASPVAGDLTDSLLPDPRPTPALAPAADAAPPAAPTAESDSSPD